MAATSPSRLLVPFLDSFPLHRHLLLLLLVAAAPTAISQATVGNVTLGSTLEDENSVWPSPSGDFAFGFYSLNPQNSTFLLGIWFDRIPEKTLVWYAADAGAAITVQRGSRVRLRSDGQLVLEDTTGQQVWAASPGNVQVAYAAMLDSGNFVLSSNASAFGWQSFDAPVDTILPTQVMNRNGKLSSRRRATDFSVGRFQLRLLLDGNLVLNTINLETQFALEAYWRSDTFTSGLQVVFNRTGEIYVANTDGGVKNVMSVALGSPENYYQRATLDHDGVFRQYVYPRNPSGTRNWPAGTWSVARHIPSNICLALLIQIGSGPCGFNSYCQLNGSGSPVCSCPPGYSPVDPADISKGCRADYVGRGCNTDGSPVEGEDMFYLEQLPDTDWPTSDYDMMRPMNEYGCRNSCLADCFCAVAIHRDNTCWKKKMPLSNGQVNPTNGAKALIKVARGANSSSPLCPLSTPDPEPPKKGPSVSRLVQTVFLGLSVSMNCFLLLAATIVCLRSTQTKKLSLWQQRVRQEASFRREHLHLRFFTYKELERATGKFQEQLGKGSFGVVYRGSLEFDGQMVPVAVKRLKGIEEEGEQEFRMEVRAIGQTHHRNLVRLLGFCDEGSHRLLVYEFMSNGSLADRLFSDGGARPSWDQRVEIAFGVARGLVYLHEDCTAQIIHCDIKPQNVLLDGDLTARISDFGLAKLLQNNHSKTMTAIRGTRGYVAPEWFRNVPVTSKVDVYSFGVVLLEIICCRRNVSAGDSDDGDVIILTDLAYDCYRYGQLSVLMGEDQEAMGDNRVQLERMVMVAIWCTQEEPSLRPSMKKVTQMLEGAVEVPVPPDPCSFTSRN